MKRKLLIFLSVLTLCSACKKEWLEEKRDINLVVPTTLKDMRALINRTMYDYVGIAEGSADDYYYTQEQFNAQTLVARNAYLWESDIFAGSPLVQEWDYSYQQIFNMNLVLEGIENINAEQDWQEWNVLKGSALFFRSKDLFNLAVLFADVYDESTALSKPGIPLRLNADIDVPVVRHTLGDTYSQIISDLQLSTKLLSNSVIVKTLPTKAAAYGMLARCFLSMNKFNEALLYADSCLNLHTAVLDFNTLEQSAAFPIPALNEEVIWHSLILPTYVYAPAAAIDTMLLKEYALDDLRTRIFFSHNNDGTVGFKGNFSGDFNLFGGLTTAEMYLIKAECLTRDGYPDEAISVLEKFLQNRYAHDSFLQGWDGRENNALELVLSERRKELVMRGLRWMDLKRLNYEGEFVKEINRQMNGKTFVLPVNDARYVMPIPQYIINTSGIAQNER